MYPTITIPLFLVLVGVAHASKIPGLLRQNSIRPVELKFAVVARPISPRLLRMFNKARQVGYCPSGYDVCVYDPTLCCPPGCTIECNVAICCYTGFHCGPDDTCIDDNQPSTTTSTPPPQPPPPTPISTPPPQPPPPTTTSTPPPQPPPPTPTSTPPPQPPPPTPTSTPPPRPPPPTSSSTTPRPPPRSISTSTLQSSNLPTSQPSSPAAHPSVAPQSSSQSTNTSVSANDSRISTSGPDWKNSVSSCDSTRPSKSNNVANETLTFKFNGSAVYMSTAQSDKSGKYSVTVDNVTPAVIDGFSNSTNTSCGFGWSMAGLQDALHTVVVTTLGQSSASSADGASNFELDGFVITQNDANSTPSSAVSLNFDIASSFRQFMVFGITALSAIIFA